MCGHIISVAVYGISLKANSATSGDMPFYLDLHSLEVLSCVLKQD